MRFGFRFKVEVALLCAAAAVLWAPFAHAREDLAEAEVAVLEAAGVAAESQRVNTLADALENRVGIQSQVGSASSGRRRLLMHGLRGEYTTVLVDGIPLYTPVASYYSWDALSLAGIESLSLLPGVSGSLLSSDSFGGVIELQTRRAKQNSAFYDFSLGNQDYRALSLVGTGVNSEGTRRATISAQYNQLGAWDSDRNQITESPRHRNASLFTRIETNFSERNRFEIRGSFLDGAVFGGSARDSIYESMLNPQVNGWTEAVGVRRFELTERWTHRLASGGETILMGGISRHFQDSSRQGFDYSTQDRMSFLDFHWSSPAQSDHQVTLGTHYKGEHLRSQSYSYFIIAGVPRDDFDQIQLGLYAQDLWKISETLQVTVGMRTDRLMVNWLDQKVQKYEIEKWGWSPRLDLQWKHHPEWLSRISVSRGYRAPLAFYEYDPAILKRGGWDVRTGDLELADSALYSLRWDRERFRAEGQARWTRIHQMSYINAVDFVRPAWVSDPGQQAVKWAFAGLGYQWTPDLRADLSYEKYFYDSGYKKFLPIAGIEDRALLSLDYLRKGWGASVTAVWVGPRDLREWGYGNRFSDPSLTQSKRANAPAFSTVDIKLSKAVKRSTEVKIYVGIKNLLNTLQVDQESPLYYGADGSAGQTQLWGVLRGREYYAGIQGKF